MTVTDQTIAAVGRELTRLLKMCEEGEIDAEVLDRVLPESVRRRCPAVSCMATLADVIDGKIKARHIIGDGETESVTVRASQGVVADGV